MTSKASVDDIRAEYISICSAINQFASLRFTLAGLYITGVGVLAVADNKLVYAKFILIIALTVCLWVVDLRTRELIENLIRRGSQIEVNEWGYADASKQPKPFITSLRTRNSENIDFLFWHISAPVTHSLGLDLLFSSIFIYSLAQLLTSG
jgi:hypothetical protein